MLTVKIALVAALLVTSTVYVLYWRPQVKKELHKYTYLVSRLHEYWIKTTNGKFFTTLTITPNRSGPNTFTVHVVDAQTGQTVTNAGVSLYTTMQDMDMGTDSINLQPDGKGNFTAPGDLGMAGDWQIRIVVRTPDNLLHTGKVNFKTSA